MADVITRPLLGLWMAFSAKKNKGKRKGDRRREKEKERMREGEKKRSEVHSTSS